MSVGGGNYKYSTICDCFVKLGRNNIQDQLKSVEPLKSHFISKYGESYSSQGASILYNKIDDLVVRRNQLAHGIDGIEIIGDDDFEPYINMIDIFAEALCNYLRSDLAKKQWENCTNQEIKAKEVYNDNVVVIETINEQFSRGGWLIYSSGTQDPHYGYCSVMSIQINDEDKESVICAELMEVGLKLKLDRTIKESYLFKTITKKGRSQMGEQ